MIKEYMANSVFAVCPSYMDRLVATINSGDIAKIETINNVSESHGYERIGSVGVISIDGATIKKNNFINAMCGGFVGYDTIAEYISKAENDKEVKTILFHVDSVGGEVAGVDTVQELISTSTKETVTIFDNIGASASIWYGSASDKIYATEATRIGSIGVKAGWIENKKTEDGEQKVLWVVSKNAKNKDCSLNGDCKSKIETMINDTEDLFYKRVMANTGLNAEELATSFNYGETITANQAFDIGFLDGVISKKALIESLNNGTTASMPSTEKIVNNNMKGTTMAEQTDVTIESLQTELATKSATIETLQKSVDGGEQKISEMVAEIATLKDAIATSERKFEVATYAVAMGMERGASKEVILEAMMAEDKLSAGDKIAEAIATSGATVVGENQIESQSDDVKDGLALKAELKRKGEL